MNIRKARQEDLPLILALLDDARAKMVASGNPDQWKPGYPPQQTIEKDLAAEVGYMVEDAGVPVGYFAFVPSPEPTYAEIDGAWLDDEPYYVLHRIASKEGAHGVLAAVMEYAISVSPRLRIDTHAAAVSSAWRTGPRGSPISAPDNGYRPENPWPPD